MENQYFTRKINEGTIKRTHFCSFDKSIKLEMTVTNSKRVMDSIIRMSSPIAGDEVKADAKAFNTTKDKFIQSLSGLRINGLQIVYEDLGGCFDDEEVLEVMAFVNGADMSLFGGAEGSIPND
jgi:hypothetical protein